ncbi:MAG: J domain-containing protein [Bacteroidetes bacterium]|nr:MAG: J domain-containing protein [Bacteroidota bacterium]
MEYKDYYKILGIDKSAKPDQIRKAFRDLAKKYHPDKNPNNKSAEDKFKQVNEAYEVLKDPEKKRKYDELGDSWKSYSNNGGRQSDFDWNQWANQSQSRSSGSGNFSDFFESIFGGSFGAGSPRSRNNRALRGEDLQATMDLTLEEVVNGTQRLVNIGGQPIKLSIKAGARNEQVLRMKGKGSPGYNGGEPGDLHISLRILKHPVFEVKGNDLYMDFYVDVLTAVLGGKVTLNTLDKAVSISIPPGTDSGKTLRLKGAGLPEYGLPDKRGELYVRILVQVPKNLSEKERELYLALQKLKAEHQYKS